MTEISTKLALLLLLPIGIVLPIVDGLLFYEGGILLIGIADLISLILVFLLVWERLRESLDKKLKYLEENVFWGLYEQLELNDLSSKQKEIEKAKNDLQRYGKFLGIGLYPKNFLKKLNNFLELHNYFYAKEEQLNEIAKKKLKKESYDARVLLKFLGFKIDNPASPHDYPAYYDTAKTMAIENSELVNVAKPLYERAKEEQKRILEVFAGFLIQNSLRLKPEPVKGVSQYN
jgi:hypothetical protein